MDKQKELELKSLALKVREHIIRMSGEGGCFIGARFPRPYHLSLQRSLGPINFTMKTATSASV
jgi:hypothetical protein